MAQITRQGDSNQMKCTVCGKKLDPLNYDRLKFKHETQLIILGEKVKNRETLMDLKLCPDCSNKMRADIIGNQLKQNGVVTMEDSLPPPKFAQEDKCEECASYIGDGFCTGDSKEGPMKGTVDRTGELKCFTKAEEPECNHDCANCDGARI